MYMYCRCDSVAYMPL